MTLSKWMVVLAAMPLLGACAEGFPAKFLTGPTDMELLARSWAKPQAVIVTPPVYCYGTLGDRDCYSEPQAKWAHRQVGSTGRVDP